MATLERQKLALGSEMPLALNEFWCDEEGRASSGCMNILAGDNDLHVEGGNRNSVGDTDLHLHQQNNVRGGPHTYIFPTIL